MWLIVQCMVSSTIFEYRYSPVLDAAFLRRNLHWYDKLLKNIATAELYFSKTSLIKAKNCKPRGSTRCVLTNKRNCTQLLSSLSTFSRWDKRNFYGLSGRARKILLFVGNSRQFATVRNDVVPFLACLFSDNCLPPHTSYFRAMAMISILFMLYVLPSLWALDRYTVQIIFTNYILKMKVQYTTAHRLRLLRNVQIRLLEIFSIWMLMSANIKCTISFL